MGRRGILGFDFGIVQAPSGPDISGPELLAAVANSGCLGFLRAPDWISVGGIVLWSGWKPIGCNKTCSKDLNFNKLAKGCARMLFTDNNFKNFPLGDMVNRSIEEWRTTNLKVATNKKGIYQPLVFHGDYSLTFTHPSSARKVTWLLNVTNDCSMRVYV